MNTERLRSGEKQTSLNRKGSESKILRFINSHHRSLRIATAAFGSWFIAACNPFTKPQDILTSLQEPTPISITAEKPLVNKEGAIEDKDIWKGIDVVKATKRVDNFRYVLEQYLQEPFNRTLAQRAGEITDRDWLALLGTIQPRESNSTIYIIVSDRDGAKKFTPNIEEAKRFTDEIDTRYTLGIRNAYANDYTGPNNLHTMLR